MTSSDFQPLHFSTDYKSMRRVSLKPLKPLQQQERDLIQIFDKTSDFVHDRQLELRLHRHQRSRTMPSREFLGDFLSNPVSEPWQSAVPQEYDPQVKFEFQIAPQVIKPIPQPRNLALEQLKLQLAKPTPRMKSIGVETDPMPFKSRETQTETEHRLSNRDFSQQTDLPHRLISTMSQTTNNTNSMATQTQQTVEIGLDRIEKLPLQILNTPVRVRSARLGDVIQTTQESRKDDDTQSLETQSKSNSSGESDPKPESVKSILKRPQTSKRAESASDHSSVSGYSSAFKRNPNFHVDPTLFKHFQNERMARGEAISPYQPAKRQEITFHEETLSKSSASTAGPDSDWMQKVVSHAPLRIGPRQTILPPAPLKNVPEESNDKIVVPQSSYLQRHLRKKNGIQLPKREPPKPRQQTRKVNQVGDFRGMYTGSKGYARYNHMESLPDEYD